MLQHVRLVAVATMLGACGPSSDVVEVLVTHVEVEVSSECGVGCSRELAQPLELRVYSPGGDEDGVQTRNDAGQIWLRKCPRHSSLYLQYRVIRHEPDGGIQPGPLAWLAAGTYDILSQSSRSSLYNVGLQHEVSLYTTPDWSDGGVLVFRLPALKLASDGGFEEDLGKPVFFETHTVSTVTETIEIDRGECVLPPY